jgi:formate--tetrahydrofolate ligase
MEDINLHFTGDFAAIEKANNLLSASSTTTCRAARVRWARSPDHRLEARDGHERSRAALDRDRPGRHGQRHSAGGRLQHHARQRGDGILCLAKNIEDLKERFASIYIGQTFDRKPVFARELNAQGAMALLLKDAIKPNLVQTLEGNPAILHGGPFANIAQGVNSVLATRMGLSLADYVVTEAGFGADLGAEKFFDIKCRAAGLSPKASVIVATIRALRYHGGADIKEVNVAASSRVQTGLANLGRHIENVGKFGVKSVVAINHFPTDTPEEIELVKEFCAKKGAEAVLADGFAKGGDGMTELARAVLKVVESGASHFHPLYELEMSMETKIDVIAREIYRADRVVYGGEAQTALKRIEKLGLGHLPVCMAKTSTASAMIPSSATPPATSRSR